VNPSQSRWHAVSALLLVVFVLALSYFEWLPFPWRQPVVALIAISCVILAREPLASIGFRWPVPIRSTVVWALAAVVVTCGFITPVIEPLLNRLTGTPADYSGYGELRGNLPAAVQLVAFAWISAAFGEEVIFRGFFLHEARAVFGSSRIAQTVSVILGATLFGLSHYEQGLVGMLLTGLAGALTGVVFLLSGRNVWAIILAHGLIDTWGVLTLYLGWY